jgi:tRNA nucleotidyltransferase (CCA-adding enzyme)
MTRLQPPLAVREICRTLEGAGFEAWCVGGAVRDALLGIETLDWDIATSARPEQVQRLFRRTVPVGIQFGTVGVLDREGVLHEVTTFRHDVETDGRHAVVRFGASLDEDLARRDFTINAIAVHAETLAVRDPFDGRGDLARQVVRCVGLSAARMEEDRLRALRAIRFAGRFGFAIEPTTWEAIRASAPHLTRLSMERVKQELDKIMEQVAQPSASMERYREAGILAVLLPALAEAPALRFRTLDHLARPARIRRPARRALRLAALFAEPGQGMPATLERTLKGLKFSNEEVALTRAAVTALGAVPSMQAVVTQFAEERALRRFVAMVGRLQVPLVARLLWARAAAERASVHADDAVMREGRRAGIRLYRRAMRIAWRDPITLGDLVIDGDDLRGIGIQSGPAIGATLKRLLDAVLDDPTRNTREQLLALASVQT